MKNYISGTIMVPEWWMKPVPTEASFYFNNQKTKTMAGKVIKATKPVKSAVKKPKVVKSPDTKTKKMGR